MTGRLAQRLTIRQLRLIVAVAEHGQLSLAAQALAMTQPAASRTLGEIEALCGDAVFDRHARGMAPTPLGELLVRRARNVIDEIGEAVREVERFRTGHGGTVRIGAVTGGAIGYVVPVLNRMRVLAPNAEIHVDVGMSRELVQRLLALRLDFALARIPPDVEATQFEAVRARSEVIDLIVGRGHPMLARDRVTTADLIDYDWVMQGPGAPIRTAVEDALISAAGRLPHIVNTPSLLVTIAMLASSDAIAPVSHEVQDVLAGLGGGIVRLTPDRPIVVAPYSLLALRGRRLSPLAQRCRDLVAAALVGASTGRRAARPAET